MPVISKYSYMLRWTRAFFEILCKHVEQFKSVCRVGVAEFNATHFFFRFVSFVSFVPVRKWKQNICSAIMSSGQSKQMLLLFTTFPWHMKWWWSTTTASKYAHQNPNMINNAFNCYAILCHKIMTQWKYRKKENKTKHTQKFVIWPWQQSNKNAASIFHNT